MIEIKLLFKLPLSNRIMASKAHLNVFFDKKARERNEAKSTKEDTRIVRVFPRAWPTEQC